jgi:ADP-ribose pyrophosphatase
MSCEGQRFSTKHIFITPFTRVLLTFSRITYTDPNGTERTWESGERLTRPKGSDIDGVGVAAILQDPAKPDDEPRIVLQKQWRPPVNATVIEVPAGLMDPDESAETCAIRELKEETGYIGELVPDNTVSKLFVY